MLDSLKEYPETDCFSSILSDFNMDIIYYKFIKIPNDFYVKKNSLTCCFYYVLEGHINIFTKQQTINMSKGDAVILPRPIEHILSTKDSIAKIDTLKTPNFLDLVNDTHQTKARVISFGEETKTILLCGAFTFKMSTCQILMDIIPNFLQVKSNQSEKTKWLNIGFDFFLTEITSDNNFGHQLIINRIFDLFFLNMLRAYFTEYHLDSNVWLNGFKDPYIAKTLFVIHRTPSRKWTVELLAQEIGLSRSALSAKFSAMLGQGVMEYISSYRISLAASALKNSNISIGLLAEKVGFSSEFVFSRSFKRKMGCLPSKYRQTSYN
ncbi:AraC family transcriptional regulator [Agitococcus lubricus]|uniref:AraC family transcriptional regulator n=1 Tax=Agitococcus lubricus TaxID=1077255 RepID=A0A2T5J3W5_9GAMM|nr:AraC family transcriptional regulator [Agitococcus lubricus]PTQ91309.1 AraC family transcriptional regulator [Agitococcus lubricus]